VPVTPILLDQRSHFSVDDADLQFVFVVQDGLCKWNGIPTANQNVQVKYIFLAGKIIRTVRSVIMKLSEKYPYREMYEQNFA